LKQHNYLETVISPDITSKSRSIHSAFTVFSSYYANEFFIQCSETVALNETTTLYKFMQTATTDSSFHASIRIMRKPWKRSVQL